MIVKELDSFVDEGDVFARAGHHAEKQMAHYLRRAFGERQSISVINGLRLERDGDVAQIDHLVFHTYGMVIVESKSVHGTVRVNEQGEWMRVYGSRRQGIPSPTEQAKRQAEFLKDYLNAHASEVGGKLLGLVQTYFGCLSVDVVVAVSDSGIIERPARRQLPEVCKADQAVEKIEELFALQKREAKAFFTDLKRRRARELRKVEIDNLRIFLPAHHVPLAFDNAPLPINDSALIAETPAAFATTDEHGANCACAVCHKLLTPKEEQYCREKAARFGEKFYCYRHQRSPKLWT